MFKANPNRTFTRTVTVYTPSESNPKAHTKGEFRAEFKQLSESRIEELQQEGDSKFLDEVLLGAREVGDENGDELPSDQAVQVIKEDSCAAAATVSEYINSTIRKNATRKN